MAPRRSHPRAEPYLWPVLGLGAILALQVALLQVALNRLIWGLYGQVLAPVALILILAVVAWLVHRQAQV